MLDITQEMRVSYLEKLGIASHSISGQALLRRREQGKQISLSQSVSDHSGQLNPNWVEWLMGYPTGHTDLNRSETP